MTSPLASALLAELDDGALDTLAELLAPKLAELLAPRLADRLPPAPELNAWMDSRGAAAYLGLSLAAVYKLTAAREIPFEQAGSGCRCWFKRDELDSWRHGELVAASKMLPNGADRSASGKTGPSKNPA